MAAVVEGDTLILKDVLVTGDLALISRVGPDDRIAQRLARLFAPRNGGLALVRDADRLDGARLVARLLELVHGGVDALGSDGCDLRGIVVVPPWVRVVLRELELVLRVDVGELVEDDEAHRGSAAVECADELGGHFCCLLVGGRRRSGGAWVWGLLAVDEQGDGLVYICRVGKAGAWRPDDF